jgi:hypothetical protein
VLAAVLLIAFGRHSALIPLYMIGGLPFTVSGRNGDSLAPIADFPVAVKCGRLLAQLSPGSSS